MAPARRRLAVDVTVETIVHCPRDTIAADATDPANELAWISGIRSARMLTDPPVGIGTWVDRVAAFLGKRIHDVREVVDHEPARRIVMTSVRGPFPMRVSDTFDDAPGGTRGCNSECRARRAAATGWPNRSSPVRSNAI